MAGRLHQLAYGDKWFVDIMDSTAAPSDGGKKTSLRKTSDGESYILVVQDVFSRFLWTDALTDKRPETVSKAFEGILNRAGTTPRSVTSDQGPEFENAFKDMLDSKGIERAQKRPADKNAIATIDVAIGNLKRPL